MESADTRKRARAVVITSAGVSTPVPSPVAGITTQTRFGRGAGTGAGLEPGAETALGRRAGTGVLGLGWQQFRMTSRNGR